MIRVMLALALWVAAALTALFALALGLYRAQPSSILPDAHLDRCAVPCWQNIQPGITARDDALARLDVVYGSAPSKPSCISTSSRACDLYEWKLPENPATSTRIEIDQGKVESIVARTPGVTLGELLLTLDNLHYDLYSVDLGKSIDRLFVTLSFADAWVGVIVQIDCPSNYAALMQMPVNTVVLQSAVGVNIFPRPTFDGLRRNFHTLCGY